MNNFHEDPAKVQNERDIKMISHNTRKTPSETSPKRESAECKPNKGPCKSIKIFVRKSPMNRISPSPDKNLDRSKTPRRRPVARSPAKFRSLDRGRLPQVEGEIEEGANSDDRSTTGSPGLNENLGTLVPPDQRDVTAPPETSTSPLKKRVPKKEPSKPKIPSATIFL